MIKTFLFAMLLTLLIIIAQFDAYAGLFSITNRTGVCSSTTVCDLLENEINSNLPDADASNYLTASGNSTVMANKGIGVDYASNIDFFVVGYSVGAGVDLGNASMGDVIDGDIESENVKGVGLSAAFMAGVNLWWMGRSDTNLYFHFMNTSLPSFSDDMSGDSTSWGFHLQYDLIEDLPSALIFKWGGVDLTTGIVFGDMKFKIKKTLNKTVTDGTETSTFNGTATVGANVKTWSIPIELSTNVQLLQFLSLYGGMGMDISGGSSEAVADLSGPITISSGGTGDGDLNLGQKDKPSLVDLRYFYGVQINLFLLKAYVQVNDSLVRDTLGFNAGIRVAF